jgi:drug/metabolite transporter (DMT)-like permease
MTFALLLLGALAGGFVSGLAGFGTALMALGIWLYVVPPSIAVPLVLICSILGQTSTMPSFWRSIDFKLVWPFLIGGLAGVPLGTLLIAHADPRIFKVSVGVLMLVFPTALYFNRTPLALSFGGRLADATIGFAGGILGGLAGLSGPLPILWASVRGRGQGRAARRLSDLQLDRAVSRAVPAGGDRIHHRASALARTARPAGDAVRRLARRAGLSGVERSEFPRRRAWPVVSVRRRSRLEWPRIAVALHGASEPATSDAMPSPKLSPEHLGLLLGFIGMAIFGGTLPATRLAVSGFDPLALTALRTAIAGLCALTLLLVLRRPLPPRRLWFQLAIAMLCVSILFPFLMALAVQVVDASHGGVVLGILPIATALVAVAITHERPKPLFWVASVAGASLVIAFALRQGGGALSAGDLQLFAAVAIAAIGFTFSGRLTAEMPGWEVISWVQVIALPISLPAAALTLPADLTHIALEPWLALLYVAVFSQWIGFFAWNAGMAMGGITRVSQVQLLQPFITFALAALFNDETITLQILMFAAAVVATVAIGTGTRVRETPVVQGSP